MGDGSISGVFMHIQAPLEGGSSPVGRAAPILRKGAVLVVDVQSSARVSRRA